MIYNQLVTWTAFVILAMFILYPIPPLAPPFSVFIPSVGAAIVDNRGEVRRLGSFPNAHSAQVEVTTCQRGHYDDHDNSDSNNYFRNDCVHIEFIKLNLPTAPPTALFFGFRTHMLFPHDTPEQDSVDRHLKLIKINMLRVNMIMIMALDRHSPKITIGQTLNSSPSLNN